MGYGAHYEDLALLHKYRGLIYEFLFLIFNLLDENGQIP